MNCRFRLNRIHWAAIVATFALVVLGYLPPAQKAVADPCAASFGWQIGSPMDVGINESSDSWWWDPSTAYNATFSANGTTSSAHYDAGVWSINILSAWWTHATGGGSAGGGQMQMATWKGPAHCPAPVPSIGGSVTGNGSAGASGTANGWNAGASGTGSSTGSGSMAGTSSASSAQVTGSCDVSNAGSLTVGVTVDGVSIEASSTPTGVGTFAATRNWALAMTPTAPTTPTRMVTVATQHNSSAQGSCNAQAALLLGVFLQSSADVTCDGSATVNITGFAVSGG